MTRSSERGRVERLRARFASSDPRLLLGIGDDAALVAASNESLVLTVDAAVEGVHFRRDLMTLEDAGYRATMAAASDLAAMGATPLALLSALVLPRSFDDAELDALTSGQAEAAKEIGAPIAGGNLSRGSEISITTTAVGHCPKGAALTRGGAKVGDAIAVAGALGLSAAGLASASGGASSPQLAPALAAFRRPKARIAEGLAARAFAHAAIDVSDGLAADASQLADASGVTLSLDAVRLVDGELSAIASALCLDALALALDGGEDYALVIACEAALVAPPFRAIGVVVAREESSLVLVDARGERAPLSSRGFDHFAR